MILHKPTSIGKRAFLILLLILLSSSPLAAQDTKLEQFRTLLYQRLDEKDSAPLQDAVLYARWALTPGRLSWEEEQNLAMKSIAAHILQASSPAATLPAFGFDRMEDQEGNSTDLSFSRNSSFLNNRKAIFAFFKTTCSYCEKELKELEHYRAARLGKNDNESEAAIIGIGLPSGLPAIFDKLKPFHEKLKLGFPLFKANDERIVSAYRIPSVPYLILFDAQGKPVATVSFPNQANLLKKLTVILDSFNNDTLSDLASFNSDYKVTQRDTSKEELADFRSIDIEYYADLSCKSCDDFLKEELTEIGKPHGVSFSVTSYDILDSESMSRLFAILEEKEVALSATPVAIIGSYIFQGLPAIRKGFADIANGSFTDSSQLASEDDAPGIPTLSAIPVFFAGLADGINPCAFSTLLFLLSFLGLAGKNKRELLVIGTVYTLTVFASYFALGLGLFASLRALSGFAAFARIMRVFLALILAVLAVANIRDGILDLKGRRKDMALVLPQALRLRIHGMIRRQRTMGFLVGGTALTALAVSIFELACTGQVYLPVIAWMVKKGDIGQGLGLLALYNTGFILPLAALFALAWSGRAIKPIATWFEARVWLSKFILASLFLLFLIIQIAG